MNNDAGSFYYLRGNFNLIYSDNCLKMQWKMFIIICAYYD